MFVMSHLSAVTSKGMPTMQKKIKRNVGDQMVQRSIFAGEYSANFNKFVNMLTQCESMQNAHLGSVMSV